MTDRMKEILENVHRFHVDNLAYVNFGLGQETVYDALVVAPSYSPDKILKDARFRVTELGGEELLHRLSGGKGWTENRMD